MARQQPVQPKSKRFPVSPAPPAWLEAAYQNVPLPISVTHARRLVWVNAEFETFYRCKLKEVLGLDMGAVVVTQNQLKAQQSVIDALNQALKKTGLGVRHFLNKSGDREVKVLVLAFCIHHANHEFRVGIAIPDDINDLFRNLIRHLLTPDFNEDGFLSDLNTDQFDQFEKLSKPGTPAKSVGNGKNGGRELTKPVLKILENHRWRASTGKFGIDDVILIALFLGPFMSTFDRSKLKPAPTKPRVRDRKMKASAHRPRRRAR